MVNALVRTPANLMTTINVQTLFFNLNWYAKQLNSIRFEMILMEDNILHEILIRSPVNYTSQNGPLTAGLKGFLLHVVTLLRLLFPALSSGELFFFNLCLLGRAFRVKTWISKDLFQTLLRYLIFQRIYVPGVKVRLKHEFLNPKEV